MNFTTNGFARKNGYRFTLRYDTYLDGERQEFPYYLQISSKKDSMTVWTDRCFRFKDREEAAAFCDDVASGQISFESIKEAQQRGWDQHKASVRAQAEADIRVFAEKMLELGVDPTIAPKVAHAFMNLETEAKDLLFDPVFMATLNLQQPQKVEEAIQSFGDWFSKYQNDIDVILVDKDTGEHSLPAICYLAPEEIESGDYDYDDWEKWVLSLPLDHIQNFQGCDLAVVNTSFTLDETCFLLGERDFETREWAKLSLRAGYAGAEFNDRLAYLQDQKPFEIPFDGTCMDVADKAQFQQLCDLLLDHNHVLITTFPDDEKEYYAYAIDEDPKTGKLIYGFDDEIPIKHTEPGKGLTATLEGKVCWAQHVGNKAKAEALEKTSPVKEAGKEL